MASSSAYSDPAHSSQAPSDANSQRTCEKNHKVDSHLRKGNDGSRNVDLEKGIHGSPASTDSGECTLSGNDTPAREPYDPNIVGWDGPDDPENPQNWPDAKKWRLVAVIAVVTLVTFVLPFPHRAVRLDGRTVYQATSGTLDAYRILISSRQRPAFQLKQLADSDAVPSHPPSSRPECHESCRPSTKRPI